MRKCYLLYGTRGFSKWKYVFSISLKRKYGLSIGILKRWFMVMWTK